MNTQDAIILLRKLEAAWPNIFARNPDREKLYVSVLDKFDFVKASRHIERLTLKAGPPPSPGDLNEACRSDHPREPLMPIRGPQQTLEGKPVATFPNAVVSFERGLRRAQPGWTDIQIDEQITLMFPNSRKEQVADVA